MVQMAYESTVPIYGNSYKGFQKRILQIGRFCVEKCIFIECVSLTSHGKAPT